MAIDFDPAKPAVNPPQIITFGPDPTLEQIAAAVNAAFSARGVIASVDIFDNTIRIQSFTPSESGSVELAEVGALGSVLPRIGFSATSTKGKNRAHLILGSGVSSTIFYTNPAPNGAHVELQIGALKHDVQLGQDREIVIPLQWVMKGPGHLEDDQTYALMADRIPEIGIRRWAFALNADWDRKSLAFTLQGDELGANEVLSYRGLWLYIAPTEVIEKKDGTKDGKRPRAVLLCNGEPRGHGGRDGDCAWDMSENPPVRYERSDGAWSVVR